ncbi:MAG TPA: GyrI-like domain-containing protein [Chloroflexi bacterium]|nr:GyrI-like domain-containing protein [Chloroflexota bacterium]
MTNYRIIERPAFDIIGRKTWISGPDNAQFGRFWERCREEGLFGLFESMGATEPGAQTGGVTLGVSRVEADPANRSFHYMIAVERPEGATGTLPEGLEVYRVPACRWAAFECRGSVPDAIVAAEIYAFTEWLPASGYGHAAAPEMEVYFPGIDGGSPDCYCEFWLPLEPA